MSLALEEAKKALLADEVPVGAVVIKDGIVIGRGYNLKESNKSALDHAEIIALQDACKNLGGWRLNGCSIYVTLEPCPMCAGAIVQSRLDRLVFGAFDPKSGACGSKLNLISGFEWNHKVEIDGGLLEDECGEILKEYFKEKRART